MEKALGARTPEWEPGWATNSQCLREFTSLGLSVSSGLDQGFQTLSREAVSGQHRQGSAPAPALGSAVVVPLS